MESVAVEQYCPHCGHRHASEPELRGVTETVRTASRRPAKPILTSSSGTAGSIRLALAAVEHGGRIAFEPASRQARNWPGDDYRVRAAGGDLGVGHGRGKHRAHRRRRRALGRARLGCRLRTPSRLDGSNPPGFSHGKPHQPDRLFQHLSAIRHRPGARRWRRLGHGRFAGGCRARFSACFRNRSGLDRGAGRSERSR